MPICVDKDGNSLEGPWFAIGDRPEFSDDQRWEIRRNRGLGFCLRCDADGLRVIGAGTRWLVECDACGWFDRLTDQELMA